MAEASFISTALGGQAGEPTPHTAGQATGQQCGPLGISILRDGTWLYQGTPIGRKELVKLFSTILSRDAQGVYWMTTPVERGTVEVEDAPFLVVALEVENPSSTQQILKMRTNVDQWVTVGPDHPLRVSEDPETGEPAPYIAVGRGLEAKVNRAIFYDLVDLAVPQNDKTEQEEWVGVWSLNTFFPLGRTS